MFAAIMQDIRRVQPRMRFAAHMLPAFHTFGVCLHLLAPLYGGAEIALYKPVAKVGDIYMLWLCL